MQLALEIANITKIRYLFMNHDVIKYSLAIVFILIAVATDYKEYKVKNKHVIVFLAIGIVFSCVSSGITGLLDSIYGFMIPLALFPLFALKMLGAGDIKGFCAIGGIVGLRMSIYTVLFSIIVGGAIALVFMIFRKNALQRFKKFGLYLMQCFYMHKLLPYDQFTDEKSGFRFTFGIFGGFILAILWVNHII